MKDLTKDSPAKVILLFAIPIVLGQLFQLFYNMADTRIVGTFLGDNSLGAIGSTTTMVDLLNGFMMGAANGFSVIAARFYGAKDEKNLRAVFAKSLLLASVMAFILSAITLLFLSSILGLMSVPDEHRVEAGGYLAIMAAGLILVAWYHLFAAILRAIGDTMTPLIFLIVSVILNIGLDILFIGGFKMGVRAAAAATVASQGVSAFVCFIYLWKRCPVLHFTKEDFKPESILIKELLAGGCSMGLMNSLISIGSVVLQSAINGFGTAIIVAHTAARKLSNLFMTPYIVLGTTMATYTSQNYGAGNKKRVKEGLKQSMLYGVIWSGIVLFITYLFAADMVRLLTDTKTAKIIETANLYLRIDTLFYL
ncbi:MAG: MATE family efflux transporter, partial [Lachnospiraceae bacterium]|nr:MATE family efflux transporter [Lachnospiraceae bacterium]